VQPARSAHGVSLRHGHRIKRIGDGLQMALRQVQVDDRVLEFDVTEQELHGAQVRTRFDEV
jgi:hypothetical protein